MKTTIKQLHVLDNLHRVVTRRNANGKLVRYLDGEACDWQIISLGAKGLVAFNDSGRARNTGESSGLIATRWG